MKYYLYVLDKQWQLYKIFNNIDKLIHWCEYHYDYVYQNIALNNNDLKSTWSDELNRYIKTHRTLLFLNQDNKIIDIRNLNLVRKHIPYPYEFYFNRKRKHFMKSKTHVYYRRLKHYKKNLKDKYFEKYENDGYNIKIYHTPNAFDLCPTRRLNPCWKDQTKRRHQYKLNQTPI
jgi:hypothetical protein